MDIMRLTKEQLDKRNRLADELDPFSEVGRNIAAAIRENNQILFAGSSRLASLIDIYSALEEMGVALSRSDLEMAPLAKSEWIGVINLALEKKMIEGKFEGLYGVHQMVFNHLLPQFRTLVNLQPKNIFFSLSLILRRELEKSQGVNFPFSFEEARARISRLLESGDISEASLREKLKISWLGEDQVSQKFASR